jgi:hypothetical protein
VTLSVPPHDPSVETACAETKFRETKPVKTPKKVLIAKIYKLLQRGHSKAKSECENVQERLQRVQKMTNSDVERSRLGFRAVLTIDPNPAAVPPISKLLSPRTPFVHDIMR